MLDVQDATVVENRILGMFRRQGWVIGLIWLLTLLAALWFSARQQRVYRASTSLVVAPDSQIDDPSDVLRTLETLERRTVIATFARIPGAPEQRAAAAEVMGVRGSELSSYRVTGAVVPNTNVLRIDVDGPDARLAANFANALADVTAKAVPALYRTFTLRVLERAVPRSQPIRPDTRRDLLVGSIAGLLVALGAGLAGDYLRQLMRSR